MEEKKPIKISLKSVIIIIFVIALIIIGLILYLTLYNNVSDEILLTGENNYYIENYNNKDYYIIQNDYSGEYDLQYLDFDYENDDINSFKVSTTMNYSDYAHYCSNWNLEKKYTNKSWNYIVFSYIAKKRPILKARLAGIEYDSSNATLYIWDDEDGLTADISAYVIIIPTEKNITNIEIQNVYELEEYYNIIGKSPIEGANYNYEDNKILAQNAYIYTNDEEVNKIFNKMLDSIVQKHSMIISKDEGVLEVMDFISSAAVFGSYNNKNGYTAYGEKYSKKYTPMGSSYEFDYGNPREKMLYDIALTYEWYLVLGLSSTEKNPYYKDGKNFLVDMTEYTCNLEETGEHYVINVNMPKGETDTYYINKDTYLIEKSEYTHGTRNNSYSYTYSDYVVTIPDEVLKNSHKEIITAKPIIYLYPTEDIELSVKLGYEDKITCSYPQYTTRWNIRAKANGDLIDLDTNKTLYALYYESKAGYYFKIQKDGFIVKGSDVTEFLEEKLAILGLTEREAEEFIVYWLPKLQENEYNYIRFATLEEINKNMPLEFSVEPDTLIRVLMTYKGLDKPIDIEEQQLENTERTGFVAVEWGGTEIK